VNLHPANTLLVQWYATPLSREAAEKLALSAKYRVDKSAKSANTSFAGIMMQTIADWWLDTESTMCPSRGIHYADTKRKMALYHLMVGQLLMSSKMNMALDYLDMGLRYADGLIRGSDYFTLYNRHEELRYLSLSDKRQKPYDLPELLNESRVIRKLTQNNQYSIPRK